MEQPARPNRLAGIMSVLLRIVFVISWGVAIVAGLAFVLFFFAGPITALADSVGWINIEGSVEIDDYAEAGQALIVSIAFIIITRELIDVLKTINRGTPFESANAARFTLIARTLILAELAKLGLLVFCGMLTIVSDLEWGDVSVGISLTEWMGAGIALVLAEVFREGARLREEQDLTV